MVYLWTRSQLRFLNLLKGQVEADVRNDYTSNGKVPKYLPKLPAFVGDHTDFMIGVKYLLYYPKKVFQLLSGLAIYKSLFKNADGTRGVTEGPQRVFTDIESSKCEKLPVISIQAFKSGYQVNPDASNVACQVQEGSFK